MKNRERNRIIGFLFLLLFQGNLFSETYQYKISCLGIRVVDIHISNQASSSTGFLQVLAKSRFITSIFPYVHNTYSTTYENGFLPLTYEKKVDQKKYFENRLITYDRTKGTAVQWDRLKDTKIPYPITRESRDFFSALLYLSSHVENEGVLWLDANRLIWKADYQRVGRENIKTALGKIPAVKLKMQFQKVSPEPKENTDMMTNQLVNEENILYLWISDDGRHLPLKAKYERKPFPVYWEIMTYNTE